MDREQTIWQYLQSKLNNPYGTAGIMGNLYAESGLNPQNLQNSYEKKLGYTDSEYTNAVDSGEYKNFTNDSAGYGLAQWTYWSRKVNLQNFAKDARKSIGDLEMQLDFLWKELQGYKEVLETLKKATSVREASDSVLLKFERPADQSKAVQAKRAEYGQNYYNKYAGGKQTMGKKVFLGVGHGGSDPGAVKYIKEADVNLAMAKYCAEYLRANGVDVKMSRTVDENDPLTEEIQECNAFNPDLAVDIHNNAGGGDGFEVFYHHGGGTSKTLAQNIETEVKAIGQNSRGLKTKLNSSGSDYYGFIRCINAPSVICEGVFVDNAADAAQADELSEQKAFGIAYAKGILKTLGVADNKPTTSEPSSSSEPASGDTVNSFPTVPFQVQVIISDLNYRSRPSMDGTIKGQTGKGVFTIVEVQDGWGRLKSGAGWIWLKNPNYCTVKGTVASPQPAPQPTPQPAKKSIEEIAREVIQGKWGNGGDRKKRLEAAGYNYSEVQSRVNELCR